MSIFTPLVMVIFLFLPFSAFLPSYASMAWTLLVFGVLISSVCFGKLRAPTVRHVWLIAAYLAMIGVVSSYPYADYGISHLNIGIQIMTFLAVGPYSLRYLASVPGLRFKAVAAFIIGQTISGAAAIAQAAGLVILGAGAVNSRTPGLAAHPNILGLLSGVAVVIIIHYLFTSSKRNLYLYLVLMINLGALVSSGSISALIACGLGLGVYMASARVSIRILSMIIGGSTIVFWLLGQIDPSGLIRGTTDRIYQVTGQTGYISTLDIRQDTYAFAWAAIAKDPFHGRGLDDSSGATFDSLTLTHNILLRSWFQGGLAMGLALSLVVGVLVALIVRAVRRGTDCASAAVLATMIGFSMTSAALQQGYYWLLVFGALSMIEPKPRKNKVLDSPKSCNVSKSLQETAINRRPIEPSRL